MEAKETRNGRLEAKFSLQRDKSLEILVLLSLNILFQHANDEGSS